jgi:hypothetical protein
VKDDGEAGAKSKDRRHRQELREPHSQQPARGGATLSVLGVSAERPRRFELLHSGLDEALEVRRR